MSVDTKSCKSNVVMEILMRISDAIGVQWAPRNIPWSRRLQTMSATSWILIVLFGEAFSVLLFVKLLYSDYWWLGLLYGAWMLNDIDICNKGGRRIEWVRSWKWWQYYCDYFPLKLVKTTELDSSRNYLFACFPHGVISSSGFGSFATNASRFGEIFPGMKAYFITLAGHFLVPFFRDYIMALGGCSSSEESILELLNLKKRRGNCVALIVGGAAEALDAHPNEYKIVLKRRKGFIRVAMKAGAPIVPVFSFGEPDVFRPPNNPQDSFVRKFQEKFRQITGVSPVFPIGRGIFQYSYGIVPFRTPITVVVGAPVEVKKNLEPTDEEIQTVHAEFTKKLIELFESEKSKYLINHENIHLIIT